MITGTTSTYGCPMCGSPQQLGGCKNCGAAVTADAPRFLPGNDFTALQPEAVQWLWRDWISLGGITLLTGAMGGGKGLLIAKLAAAAAGYSTWPDGSECEEPVGVMWCTAEDHPRRAMAPRGRAAGILGPPVEGLFAPVRYVASITDLDQLLDSCEYFPGLGVLLLDNLSDMLADAGADENSAAEVGELLGPLNAWCREHDVAAVIAHHLNKSIGRDTESWMWARGAVAAKPRAVMMLQVDRSDPEGSIVLAKAKTNEASYRGGMRFKVAPALVEGPDGPVGTARLDLVETLEGQGPDLLRAAAKAPNVAAEVRDEAAERRLSYIAVLRANGGPDRIEVIERRLNGSAEQIKRARARLVADGEIVVTRISKADAVAMGIEPRDDGPTSIVRLAEDF